MNKVLRSIGMNRSTATAAQLAKLRHLALILVWVGLLWNIVELLVALWSGIEASSIALLGYGLDSLLELFAGLVLVWRLGTEWKDEIEERDSDRKALRAVGITFFALSAYILFHAIATLVGWLPQPKESLVGIGLVIASAVVMTVLYFWKTSISKKIGSRALKAEATESLACDLQDLTLLVGLGANAILGWWWADPVAAVLLIPWLLKEGREAFLGEEEE
jgi:divalent metal cation (Fe/Co/Zn/Cd) transporter